MNSSCSRRERGISLFVVMVMLLLTTLLLVWASRSSLLNEMVTGNDSDYQRAFEAAQAMVRDAELDIMNARPDGSPCGASASAKCREWTPVLDIAGKKAFFPTTEQQLLDLQAALSGISPSCVAGICISTGVEDQFWKKEATLTKMKEVAATYGSHTDAIAATAGNPLLETRAWYWIELLPYHNAGGVLTGGLAVEMAPDISQPYIYRITAIAQGQKPLTQAVVRTIFVRRTKT